MTEEGRSMCRKSNSILNIDVRKQLFASLTVNFLAFCQGIAVGWTAPTIIKLTSPETPLDFPLTINELSWIASLIGLGAVLGNFILCFIIDTLGRKGCFIILTIPLITLWVFIYTAPSVEFLYAGRFIGGITGGACFGVIPIFINEISDKKVCGAFQSFFQIALNLGILIGYILASELEYYLMICVAGVLPVIFIILMFCFPETPQQLLKKGKEEAAWKSLMFYQNQTEPTSKCQQDFDDIKAEVSKSKLDSKLQFGDFVTKPALKAYFMAMILLVMHQFSGMYSFAVYMSEIFSISGAPLEPNTSTIIMGIVQLLGNFATILLIDRFRRKSVLIFSTICVILGLVVFGLFTYYKDSTSYTWVPLVIMIFTIFMGNFGIVSVVLIIIVELLPEKIRAAAFTCFMGILNLFIFFALKIFPIALHSLGISNTFWICAVVTSICLGYLSFFLPETQIRYAEVK